VTPEESPDPEKIAKVTSTVISDVEGTWAGWMGIPGHSGPAHGTVILSAGGDVVWSATDSQPYMDVDDVVRRISERTR
ncbi:MAG: hypothetical protein AAF989_16980, partial [Planctomycetota bacterium]